MSSTGAFLGKSYKVKKIYITWATNDGWTDMPVIFKFKGP